MTTAQQAPDDLLFALADTLGITLNLMGSHFRGIETRKLFFGPWQISTETCVCTDILTEDAVSAFARVEGRVWLYLVSKSRGGTVDAYVFDSHIAGIYVKDQSTYGGVSIQDTLAKLRPAIKAELTFDGITWKRLNNASALV